MKKKHIYVIVFLVCIVIVSYANGLFNDFVSDDRGLLMNAPLWSWSFLIQHPFQFIRTTIYIVLQSLFGLNPLGFRLANILFHIGNSILIYILLFTISSFPVAVLTAGIFAIHPILTESVTWISSGIYPQYAFFFLLSLYFYIINSKNNKWSAMSIVSYILALLSSEKAVALNIIFILYEICFGRIKTRWKPLALYTLLSIVYIAFYYHSIGQRLDVLSTAHYQLEAGYYNPLIQVPVAISTYLNLMFWPKDLTIYHSEMQFSIVQFVFYCVETTLFFGFILYGYYRDKFIFFWLSFFIVALLTTLTPLKIAWIVAERYAYLGSIGIIVCVVYIFLKLYHHGYLKFPLRMFFLIVFIGFMIRTIQRNQDWTNEDTLWIATARTSPSNPVTHNNLGDVYGRHGDVEGAVREFQKAIDLNPQYADAYHNLGNAYRDLGKIDLALSSYQKAYEINSGLWQSYQNIAEIFFIQEKYPEAQQYLMKGLEANPNNTNLLLNLGVMYAKLGETEKSKEAFLKILTIDPKNEISKRALLQLESGGIQ